MRRKVCWQSGKSSGCRIRCELSGSDKQASGLTNKKFCAQRGISEKTYCWLRKVREGVCPKFCVNTAKQCKIEPKCFKAGAAPAVAALSTK